MAVWEQGFGKFGVAKPRQSMLRTAMIEHAGRPGISFSLVRLF